MKSARQFGQPNPRPLYWKVHTPNLLGEIVNNNGLAVLRIPLLTFAHLLTAVANRCSELNDPRLNALMMRLALYEVADPESKQFDAELVQRIIREGTAA